MVWYCKEIHLQLKKNDIPPKITLTWFIVKKSNMTQLHREVMLRCSYISIVYQYF